MSNPSFKNSYKRYRSRRGTEKFELNPIPNETGVKTLREINEMLDKKKARKANANSVNAASARVYGKVALLMELGLNAH